METTSCKNVRLHIMDQVWSGPSSETAHSKSFVLAGKFSSSKENAGVIYDVFVNAF